MSLKDLAKKVRAEGRGKDDQLVHLTSREVAGLHQLAEAAGGRLTTNPKTGLPEAGFLDSLLPTIIGGAVGIMTMNPMAGAAAGAAVGGYQNKDSQLGVLGGMALGAMGGYGGAGLASGLQGLGANQAATQAITQAVPEATAAHASTLQAMPTEIASNFAAPDVAFTMNEAGNSAAQAAADKYVAAGDAARSRFSAEPMYQQLGKGFNALGQPGGATEFIKGMGGGMQTAKTAGMAAAPMIYDSMMPKPMGGDEDSGPGELPKYKYAAELTGNYYQPGQGTHERQYFTQPTFQRMAGGGIAGLAKGGPVHMESGDFVIPADVTAYAGGGSTEAGMEALSKKLGAVPIRGAGDGLSDDIPATIDGKPMARVANGEMLVKQPGKEGTKKLYAALAKIRKQATGRAQQIKPVDLDKALA